MSNPCSSSCDSAQGSTRHAAGPAASLSPFPGRSWGSWHVGTAGTVPFSPFLCLTLPSGHILPWDYAAHLAPCQGQSWGPLAAWGDTGHPCYLCTVQNCGLFLIFVPVRLPEVGQRHHSRYPCFGSGLSHCSVPRQQEEAVSSSPLQVLGLTRQPHSLSVPAQIPACAASLSRKPWDAAVWRGSPAPATQEGSGSPHLPLKHYRQSNLHCPGAWAASEALPTPHLPGSPGSCCCLPQASWLHG